VPARQGDVPTEHGCDDPVSLTPPTSVMAAEQLACRSPVDQLARDCTLPATTIYILDRQEAPYNLRRVNSLIHHRAVPAGHANGSLSVIR